MMQAPEARAFLVAAVECGTTPGDAHARVLAFLSAWDVAALRTADPMTVSLLDRMAGPCRTMAELADRLAEARSLVAAGGRDASRWLCRAYETALAEEAQPRRRRIVGAPLSAALRGIWR